MKSPAAKRFEANRRREVERREATIYGTVRALVEAAAERWTVENLGASWPTDRLDEFRAEVGDEPVDLELNDWRAEARKCAEKVLAAKLPLTLASMEDAFHNRIPNHSKEKR